MPEADPRRLAAFGFLLPSMAFWPSSIGKEAVMVLGIGLVANGAARQWTGARGGMALVAGGLGVTALVRPHITLLLVAALLGAVMVTRWDAVGSSDPLRKVASIGILVGLLIASVVLANSFFEIDTSSGEQLSDVFEQTEERTDRGGSTFETSGPLLFPWTVVTVLFRPFPFEATNFQTAITSLETTFLLVVTIARRRVLGRLVRSCRQLPMVAFVLVFGALFVLAYSNFGNFGILARQRVQLYPLLVGLLCVPTTWPNLRLPGPGWSADRRGGREAAGLEAIRGARR